LDDDVDNAVTLMHIQCYAHAWNFQRGTAILTKRVFLKNDVSHLIDLFKGS